MDALAALNGELEEEKSAHDCAFHVTDVSPVQPENALLPEMDVTDSPTVTDVSPVQPLNTLLPMDVTDSPTVTDVNPLQP